MAYSHLEWSNNGEMFQSCFGSNHSLKSISEIKLPLEMIYIPFEILSERLLVFCLRNCFRNFFSAPRILLFLRDLTRKENFENNYGGINRETGRVPELAAFSFLAPDRVFNSLVEWLEPNYFVWQPNFGNLSFPLDLKRNFSKRGKSKFIFSILFRPIFCLLFCVFPRKCQRFRWAVSSSDKSEQKHLEIKKTIQKRGTFSRYTVVPKTASLYTITALGCESHNFPSNSGLVNQLCNSN